MNRKCETRVFCISDKKRIAIHYRWALTIKRKLYPTTLLYWIRKDKLTCIIRIREHKRDSDQHEINWKMQYQRWMPSSLFSRTYMMKWTNMNELFWSRGTGSDKRLSQHLHQLCKLVCNLFWDLLLNLLSICQSEPASPAVFSIEPWILRTSYLPSMDS